MMLAGLAGLLACPAGAGPLAEVFAGCTGRFSAQMAHQWLMSDPEADRTGARRAAMISLLEAAMAPGEERALLAIRIEAKYAHNLLLTRATFSRDAGDAAWAAERAEAEISDCAALLIG